MSWGRILFLRQVGTRVDEADAESEIAAIKKALRSKTYADQSQDLQLKQLREENDELKLYLAAIARLLISKGILSQGEISKFVEIIDAEDGIVDGRMRSDLV